MIWFTADYHLGHDKIIDLCSRPFKNSTHMDKTLIRNHNKVVGKDDDVYILGDFSIKTKNHRGYLTDCVNKLNGRLHLILGNHDVRDVVFLNEIGFWATHYPYFEVEEFILVHDPVLSAGHRDLKFLCGHVHDLFVSIKNVLNVGVDVHDFKPISLEYIRLIFPIYKGGKG